MRIPAPVRQSQPATVKPPSASASAKPSGAIANGVWLLFFISVLVFTGTIFFVSWDSAGPAVFDRQQALLSLERSIPEILQVPLDGAIAVIPLIFAAAICLLLRFVPPTNTTRLIFKSILIILAVRYLIWRTVATLNLSHWASASLSVLLYVNELICFICFFFYTVHTIWENSSQRRAEATRFSEDVLAGRYLPPIDVFIPTYNESEAIVRRTAIGCQAMAYPNKTVYILDDTRRPQMRQLAEELGCGYITRPDNAHAKAGNLNNALKQTSGELIAVFDADFVPFRNFLTRTVGFFQQPHITLVQTKQDFYNPDYHARNLGIDHLLPNDQESFYGYIQPCWDVANSVICCGTSYVVRRSDLEFVGGYYTRCCVEDLQTSFLMRSLGLRLIFLNETLSMGESTRTYADFIDQRLRWLQGNLQIHYCQDEVPFWRNLNWVQRSYVLAHLLCCFSPVFRFGFLVTPLLSAYLGILPYIATLSEVVYYFVPFMLLNLTMGGWTSGYRTSTFWHEVYDTVFCFPGLRRLWLVLRQPFARASRVTRKGVKAETKNYNFRHTLSLLILLALTVAIIAVYLLGYFAGLWLTMPVGSGVTFFWLLYNATLITVAVLSSIDQPVRRQSDRFPLRTTCKLTFSGRDYWGHTKNVSDTGALLTITSDLENGFCTELQDQHPHLRQTTQLEFLEYGFSVDARILRTGPRGRFPSIALQFSQVTIPQNRHLVELLYSDMTWWKQTKTVGGLDALLALLASVFKFRPVLSTYNRG
jgi:cellulose synthase (UDP-forming)